MTSSDDLSSDKKLHDIQLFGSVNLSHENYGNGSGVVSPELADVGSSGMGVNVGTSVLVAVLVGVSVNVGTGVNVGGGVNVTVGVFVKVGIGVNVGVFVTVGTNVGVSVSVYVAVGIIMIVGSAIVGTSRICDVDPTTITNCGGLAPWRLEKRVAVASVVVITRLTSPAPVTSDVTFVSSHVPAEPDPDELTTLPKAGALL